MASSSSNVRVIKRGKRRQTGHHGGAWKVAYADFVTAMMAFFLVMWIIGLSAQVKEAISAYFKDPTGFMRAINSGENPLAKEGGGGKSLINVGPNLPKKPIETPGSTLEEKKRFEAAKSELEKIVNEYPEFKDLANSIRVRVVNEGLRIDLVESAKDLFFDSGSALTKPRTRKLLAHIAQELGKLPNKVVIEGHTDSLPYSGPNGWTNWELSTARANAARYVMEAAGLRKGQLLEVRGLADRMPLDAKHPDSFRNRRVSILLPYQRNVKSIARGLLP